jgi:hypothetical protein
MDWLLELRRHGNPLALAGLYAVGVTVAIAWVGLLPGEPSYEGPGRSLAVAAALSMLLVFFILRGSRTALRLAWFAHGLGLVLAVGTTFFDGRAFAFSPKALGLAILQAFLLLLVTAPSLERYCGVRPR